VTVFKRLANDSVIYGGSDLLSKIIAFLTFPIMATALSPKSYGTIELVLTATGLLSIFVNFGINNSVQRFYWEIDKTYDQKIAIVTSALFLLLCTSGISLFVGFLALPWVMMLIDQNEWPITVFGIIAALILMVFSQITTFALDVIRLHFLPWKFLLLSLTLRILTLIIVLLAVVKWDMGADGLFEAQAIVAVILTPLFLLSIKKDINVSKISFVWIKEIGVFGYPFIFAGLAYWLFGSLDRWMLASMSSIEEVGIYSVAFRYASLLIFVISAFSQAWSPQAIKIKNEYPNSYRKIYGYILLLLLLIMLVTGGAIALFSGEIIHIFMPNEYSSSALPFTVLCFGIILQSTIQITAIGISIERKTYIFIVLVLIAAIVNCLLNLFLIPKYGATGAAYSTLIAYIVLSGTYFYTTQKVHHIEVDTKKLTLLLTLVIILFLFSVVFIETVLILNNILFKLFILFVCALIGYIVVRYGKINYE